MTNRRFSSAMWPLWMCLVLAPEAAAQSLPYGTGNWDPEKFGNHRAVMEVPRAADAVRARIMWRRRDPEPERKDVIFIQAATGTRIDNVVRLEVAQPYGEFIFQAPSPGQYYAYFLPYTLEGRNYPKVTYRPPEARADPAWLERNPPDRADYPRARVIRIDSVDEFSSFHPMEVTAAPAEVEGLLRAHPGAQFLLFPEDRTRPIRMTDHLPLEWTQDGATSRFAGRARRGEFYVFQIGLFAAGGDIDDLRAVFSDLKHASAGYSIPGAAMQSFNTDGVNWDGRPFTKKAAVGKGKVQPLWFGVQIPPDAPAGDYRGIVTLSPAGMAAQSVHLSIAVESDAVTDSGDDEPWRHSRLRWLNSRLAMDDEAVQPFVPITVSGSTLGILGRSVKLDSSGLPAQIQSYFSPEVTAIGKIGRALLSAPIRLAVEDANGKVLAWASPSLKFTNQKQGLVQWEARSAAGPLSMLVQGSLEPDGFANYGITLAATSPFEAGDIRLELPLVRDVARYVMGLGLKGGYRPAQYEWRWDVTKNQDGAWIGDANAGLQFSLRAENYSRPLNTNFYQSKPLNMPPSWFNGGRGGVSIRETGSAVRVTGYGGRRTLRPGEPLHFDFTLLLTPFKPMDTAFQWKTRFYHAFRPVADVLRAGSNTINVHHANEANPYINYPFIHQKEMKSYIDEAHRNGLKVKIYYTIRELSNRAPELFALRSLGNEIFSEGPGGGYSWLQEHIGSNYIAAWFVPQLKDAAIINSGMSRWHNYYIEGLDWLARKMEIDGLYIDDVAFDRTTMKRVRKVLDRRRDGAIIDLHSANQYNPRDGFANSAGLYMEHFPYINRLWFGEYFDPNSPPDFWLVEMSGIPYGLMGEMLQDGGNRWRGMLYGMTSRMPYDGNNPSPVWKVWDDFGIQKSEMIGYWSPRCPVRTDNGRVLATAYVSAGKTLVSLASWAEEDVQVRLAVDWRALGLKPGSSVVSAAAVKDFQTAREFSPTEPIPVPKGKGWLLIISGATDQAARGKYKSR